MAGFGKGLAGFGRVWWRIREVWCGWARFGRGLVGFGGVWQRFGEVWQGLARFGEGLARFDEVWRGLARFGEVWPNPLQGGGLTIVSCSRALGRRA